MIAPGRLPQIVDQAEEALIAARAGVYQRGDMLTRVARVDVSQEEGGLRRAEGATILVQVREHWLLEQMARSATWLRPTANRLVPADPDTR